MVKPRSEVGADTSSADDEVFNRKSRDALGDSDHPTDDRSCMPTALAHRACLTEQEQLWGLTFLTYSIVCTVILRG
jgi:hypothetical protein